MRTCWVWRKMKLWELNFILKAIEGRRDRINDGVGFDFVGEYMIVETLEELNSGAYNMHMELKTGGEDES